MDRRVKERLVGASILVALIVLIVPELLSGPKPAAPAPLNASAPTPTRSVSVDLATSKAMPETSEVIPPASTAENATPFSSTNAETQGHASETPNPPPLTVTTLKAQEPNQSTPVETAPSPPKSGLQLPAAAEPGSTPPARHSWALQLGSFASKANADKLVHQLKASGSSVYVISSGSGSSERYRVRVGPLPDREAAMRAITKLKAQGHAATLVTPSS
jgi:DedD protein